MVRALSQSLASVDKITVVSTGDGRSGSGVSQITGEVAKSRKAYQDFFALWKDADPDIPILKQAKAEYAKLQ